MRIGRKIELDFKPANSVVECPSGLLAQVRFIDEFHTDYYSADEGQVNLWEDVGRPDGGCIHDFLLVSSRDQSKRGNKKHSEVFCGHSK